MASYDFELNNAHEKVRFQTLQSAILAGGQLSASEAYIALSSQGHESALGTDNYTEGPYVLL